MPPYGHSTVNLNQPGTYVLLLHLPAEDAIRVGRLGRVELPAGFYAYVGSALGPGGLKARLRHHQGQPARSHWHIDYLRRATHLVQIWISAQKVRREHDWAHLLSQVCGAVPVAAGFGTSDCDCCTHLFWWAEAPAVICFRRLVRTHFPADAPVDVVES
ncbi:MAG: GIY-YIG nuclease family protein [Candidatus Latescibacteria bacterium]|nr:GIY-YIG nuclease family protein [Candidatus Latescibacterota bacterium]